MNQKPQTNVENPENENDNSNNPRANQTNIEMIQVNSQNNQTFKSKTSPQNKNSYSQDHTFSPITVKKSIKEIQRVRVWNSFKAVVSGFLGNNKAENYEKLVEDTLTNFKAMGCRMSLKVHMLHAHLDKFKNNMGAYSEEQGERFHQDIMNFEQRYQGQYNENMMGDYIWGLLRESSYEHKRKSKSVHF
ncbi:uncharacterized protein LOC125500692 [Athalia rosae]|uniref:uncharacterized protein LOC125500692 n=1 Tax=Athalia rosae TaxID=37344 RepID=UPI0020341D1E|nr:uncharacterized protein LOC125500692 [Athalia rosae]